MNTKRILTSVVAGAMLTGSVFAAHGNDQPRTRTKARAAKTTAVTKTTAGNVGTVRTRNRVVTSYPRRTYRTSRSYSYGYPYSSYGYGYPYYSYGPSFSFGYGYPYSSYGNYPYDYNYGYYSYNRPGYAYSGDSVVVRVQSRLARAGYYHGPIDGVMGSGTRHAILAYERDHGLRMDGTINGPLLRNMGLRY